MPPRKVVSRTSYVDPNKVGRKAPPGTKRVFAGITAAEWACSSCGHDGISGLTKVCPRCNNPKGSDETYQPPRDLRGARRLSARELTAAGVDEDHSSDQQCAYCGGFSHPGTAACPYCGANLADVARASRKCHSCGTETNNVTCASCGETTKPKGNIFAGAFSSPIPTEPQTYGAYKPEGLLKYWWIFAGAFFVILLGFWGLWPRQTVAKVVAVSWKCTVQLEEYQYNAREGWDPQGDITGQEERVHHYDTIIDGYHEECKDVYEIVGYETVYGTENVCENEYVRTDVTCYDDGTCENDDVYEYRCHTESTSSQEAVWDYVEHCEQVADTHDEPRYATWYFYKVWEWNFIGFVEESGNDFAPYWPSGYTIDQTHREGGKEEQYTVTLIDETGEDQFVYTTGDYADYYRFQLGTRWNVTSSGGIITEIEIAE
jgi:hypothetical protein